jgi:glycosyltransferase involved in cell wall biosynthesis
MLAGVSDRESSVSVVIPVYNSAAHLTRCLAGLAASTSTALEIIVVDDGSTDTSADAARNDGARVLRVPDGPQGPAVARNLGAAHARGNIVLFLDADVVVHRDTVEKIARCFADHAEVAAVFGSYDDAPDAQAMASRYRNLLHHYVHQEGACEASTFWAGCGAVRRAVFTSARGFDEGYRRPSIEDIELGARLRAAGHRILLRPDIQVKHLKRWTVSGVVRSDIRDRAIPWTRLILRQEEIPQDLNTSTRHRLAAVAAWLAVGSLVLLPFVGRVAAFVLLAVAALALVVLGAANRDLYTFFFRRGGLPFAVVSVLMHGLYLLYSSAIFGVLFVSDRAARIRRGRVAKVRPGLR